MASFHSISEILSVAAIHPFYNPSCRYPPSSPHAIAAHALKSSDDDGHHGSSSSPQLQEQPLLHKDQLYRTVERLCADEDAENGFRLSSYISTTGGGSGKGIPMLFLTDADENQKQRVAMGALMKACRMLEPSDWVLNLHPSGFFYRALDFTTQVMEQVGANVLCAGHLMPREKLLAACTKYHVNVLAGDASDILNLAHHVATVSSGARSGLRITKIIYTCEMLSKSKRDYLVSVFGPTVAFFSMFASAETGPWAVADFAATGEPDDGNAADLLFDTRAMTVEVLSLSSETMASRSTCPPAPHEMLPDGHVGHLVLTSLQRVKNPLVRYLSGDIGSLRPLPPSAASRIQDADARRHCKVLRLLGRDRRFSFKWLGEYFEFESLEAVMATEGWGILQWQVLIEQGVEWEGSDSLELRLMRRRRRRQRCQGDDDDDETEMLVGDEELRDLLKDVFFLTEWNEKLFRATFLDDVAGFRRSETSGKVIRFLDLRGG